MVLDTKESGNNGGWDKSADAWITAQGQDGDWARRTLLDAIMAERAKNIGGKFIDIGCGEGRFVRMLQDRGMTGMGIDPIERLIACAKERDPNGDYRIGIGEKLDMQDDSFDLAISYLALIDIEHYRDAIAEMVRVTKSGGSLLIANLTSFFTAGKWVYDADRNPVHYPIDNYHEERPSREQWSGIDIINWHRPLGGYFSAFLSHGLTLKHFSEPTPPHQNDSKHDRYSRVPGYHIMEWQKPA